MDSSGQAEAATPSASATASAATEPKAGAIQGLNQTSVSPPASTEAMTEFRFICFMNARYHAAREAFLDSSHRWLMFGVILFGSLAVVEVVGAVGGVAPFRNGSLSALAAIMGALDLTFDLSNRARQHSLMKRRYYELLADVELGVKNLTEGNACLHRYSAEEEPAYYALLESAHNATQRITYGDRADIRQLRWHHRVFKNFLRFETLTDPKTSSPRPN